MKYLSTFSGIGGFELGIQLAYESISRQSVLNADSTKRNLPDTDGEPKWRTEESVCIGYSEIDKYATAIYQKHFPTHKNYGDITTIDTATLPDFDLLVGGFPCQAFSIAGKRRGFEDTRGTMFFELARILRAKQPRLFVFENVKGLLSHDNGQTFRTIIATLDELGYDLQWQVLNSKNHGVPQNRERVFIIGQRKDTRQIPIFPLESPYANITQVLNRETVYLLSEDISKEYGLLLSELSQSKEGLLSREQMQRLLTKIKQGISQGSCRNIQSEAEGLDSDTKGGIQVVEELNSWSQGVDNSREVCGVVQIPTEEMLLLWNNSRTYAENYGQVQQQGLQNDGGQNRFLKGLRGGEYGSLLLAVQPYQGRLFYSVGNGRDWQKIYTTKMEEICRPTLSSILEENPDQKYFLSQETTQKILGNVLERQESTILHEAMKSEKTDLQVA